MSSASLKYVDEITPKAFKRLYQIHHIVASNSSIYINVLFLVKILSYENLLFVCLIAAT